MFKKAFSVYISFITAIVHTLVIESATQEKWVSMLFVSLMLKKAFSLIISFITATIRTLMMPILRVLVFVISASFKYRSVLLQCHINKATGLKGTGVGSYLSWFGQISGRGSVVGGQWLVGCIR